MKINAKQANFGAAVLLAGTLLAAASISPARADTSFPQTGQSVWGPFETYWKSHGGVAQFGMPRTTVFPAKDGSYDAQYFERALFTHNPKNPDPYKVELQLLGSITTANRSSEQPFTRKSASAQAGSQYFAATGHNLGGKFLEYWNKQGGLPIYGYPISEQFTEKSKSDGKDYLVQYFERNRFEYHPELAGTPYEIQLGLLGSEDLDAHGGPDSFTVAKLGTPHSYPQSTGQVVVVATPDNTNRPPIPEAPTLPATQSSVLLTNDFSSSDLSAWQQVALMAPPDAKPAAWKVASGRLVQSGISSDTGSDDDAAIVTKRADFSDFTMDSLLYPQSGEPIGVVFRYSASGFYLLTLSPSGSMNSGSYAILTRWNGTSSVRVAASATYSGYDLLNWQRVTVTAKGQDISVSINGQPIVSAHDAGPASGAVGFYTFADGSAVFDNLRVTAP